MSNSVSKLHSKCEMVVEFIPHPEPDEALRRLFMPGLLEMHKRLISEALEKGMDSIHGL